MPYPSSALDVVLDVSGARAFSHGGGHKIVDSWLHVKEQCARECRHIHDTTGVVEMLLLSGATQGLRYL